jgi:hypothetical protein
MNINFSKGAWSKDELTYAYTYRFAETNEFIQNEDSIENAENPQSPADGYDYLSLVTKEAFGFGTKITTRCSFEGNAAPLIVIPQCLDHCDDGHKRYGRFYEVVLYKNGINVWNHWRTEDGTPTWHKCLGMEFPVTAGEIHTLAVEFKENYMVITLDGAKTTLRADDLFPSFHLGVTGCEGPCKFYDMTVES